MAQPPNLLLTMLLKHGLALLIEAVFELNLSSLHTTWLFF